MVSDDRRAGYDGVSILLIFSSGGQGHWSAEAGFTLSNWAPIEYPGDLVQVPYIVTTASVSEWTLMVLGVTTCKTVSLWLVRGGNRNE